MEPDSSIAIEEISYSNFPSFSSGMMVHPTKCTKVDGEEEMSVVVGAVVGDQLLEKRWKRLMIGGVVVSFENKYPKVFA